jgi:HSP20 family protein
MYGVMNDRNTPFEGFDRLFETMMRSMSAMPAAGTEAGVRSGRLRMEQTDEGYVVVADLPGFEREDIDLRFGDGVLTVEADSETETGGVTRSRRVTEGIRVPGDVDVADVEASYRNGVIEITVPVTDGGDESHHIPIR